MNAFGNALGNSIAGAIKHANLPEEVKNLSSQGVAAYEQAKARGWDTDEAIIAGRRAHDAHREANGYGGANGTRYDGATFEGGRFTLRPEGPEAFSGPYDNSGIRTFAYHDSGFDPVESVSLLGDEGISFPPAMAGQRAFIGVPPSAGHSAHSAFGQNWFREPIGAFTGILGDAFLPNVKALGDGGNPSLLGTAAGFLEAGLLTLADMASSVGMGDPRIDERGMLSRGFDRIAQGDERLVGRALFDGAQFLPIGAVGTATRGESAVLRMSGAGAEALTSGERIAAARLRQYAMLDDNVGFNISPVSWDQYPTIGRSGTFVSDRQGVMSYFGDLSGRSEVTIPQSLATSIESDMGLVPGSLNEGFKVRQVTGVRNLQPISPMEGNAYFLGAGNHLPRGAPEMVIRSIPTVDNDFVNTILRVNIAP